VYVPVMLRARDPAHFQHRRRRKGTGAEIVTEGLCDLRLGQSRLRLRRCQGRCDGVLLLSRRQGTLYVPHQPEGGPERLEAALRRRHPGRNLCQVHADPAFAKPNQRKTKPTDEGSQRLGDDDGHRWGHHADMSLFPDLPPKRTPEERRAREADRLKIIRLRMAIGRELEERGINTPAAIGTALDLPSAEVTQLLTRRHSREGDVARLEAVAARLGVQVLNHSRPGG
jgi:hypothetical protein